MKKRLVSLSLLAVVVVLSVAPVAMADHCKICRLRADGNYSCWFATTGGKLNCDDFTTPGTCVLSGTCGGPHPLIEEPLAADFTVASVERLDEPQTVPASETRVASLETAPAANR